MAQTWERQKRESSRAFAAFVWYRDLGPTRSLYAAYREYRRDAGANVTSTPGTWTAWSTRHKWVERAAAFDAWRDAERLVAESEARANRIKQLEAKRTDYELANQDRLERRIARIEAILDKADAHPIADVKQEKSEDIPDEKGRRAKTFSKTVVKGINFSGYARLAKEARDAAKDAIVGVRDQAPPAEGDQKSTGEAVRATFEWVKPAESPTAEK